MTIMFVESKGKSDYNGFNDGELNYYKCASGILNCAYLQLSQSSGMSFESYFHNFQFFFS